MTREEVCAAYTVKAGVIRSPGKFEGEPVYVPHFYAVWLDGFATYEEDGSYHIEVCDDDRKQFPELGAAKKVFIIETDNGFVYCRT